MTVSDQELMNLFGVNLDHLESMRENGILNDGIETETSDSDETEFDVDGCAITKISYWAAAHNITHQRANQLAEMGIVVRVRHGFCNFPESHYRYAAFLRDERLRSSSRDTSHQLRDETYYAMEGRTMQLRIGAATPGELRRFCQITSRLLRDAAELNNHVMGTDSSQTTRSAAEAIACTCGILAVALTRASDLAFDHANYLHRYQPRR